MPASPPAPLPAPSSGADSKRFDRIFWVILALAFVLRIYHLLDPFWDYFASRQTFNLLVVRQFVAHGISLFRPEVDWLIAPDPNLPSYFCAEFPWLHALAALEMRALHLGDWCTRLIPITFSIAGLCWIYSLTYRMISRLAAQFAALAWAVLPFSIFFGRAFMSDGPALALAAGTLDRFCAWLDARRPVDLLACAALGSFATLAKPQTATFGLVMLYLGFLEFRWRLFTRFSLYVVALAMALPAALAIRHSAVLSRAGGPPVIGAGLIGRSLQLWLQASTWREQWHRLSHPVLGPVALLLCAAGLLWPLKNPKHYLFHVWFLATALFLFLIPRAILGWNDYYMLLLVPASAGLIGTAMRNLSAAAGEPAVSVLLIMALMGSSILAAASLFRSDKLHFRAGRTISGLTQPGDLIATSAGGAPDPLYFSGRRGWEAGRFDLSRLERLSAAGAKVFAITDPDAIRYNTQVVQQADRRFVRLTPAAWSDWMIWSLDQVDLPSGSLVHGNSQAPPAGNFGGAIDLHDVLCREILRSPPAIEVSYSWQCLRKIDANLRALVHVTTPAGQIVRQQDHWPVAGHRLTPDWRAGESIRERFLLLLPEGQVPGRYQLRIGWFDPRNGVRLTYQGEAADGENRAIVAEFDVHRKPSPGFFSSE